MGDDDDKAAIMAVLRAETDAWLRRDFDTQQQHWVHGPTTRRVLMLPHLGVQVFEGWDAIGAFNKTLMERYPQAFDMAGSLEWDRVSIVVGADMAWVSYDQIGTEASDDFAMPGVVHELKIVHRVERTWKIACIFTVQAAVEIAHCPLVEVDGNATILWMNPAARDRLRDHPGLVVAGHRLCARRHDRDAELRAAVDRAFRQRSVVPPPRQAGKRAHAVPLGRDDYDVPLYCWVTVEDGKTLVSFDDAEMLARRIDLASEVFGLSPAQARLARLIAEGQDLSAASDALGVSVNTLRTQLQRIFDKTGVRSQAALVRALLSTDAPRMEP